ncbi:MAG: hypothetical protein COB02_16335 [Candidatus Cloacimonadota bacterium]|nr:MAG: hypothetical protein COB02_16335 [Candidatus Cloacimonadota bacterium]
MIAHLNHVAILVENITPIIQSNLFTNSKIGQIDQFDSEGTKEVYIGEISQSAKVLLIEAFKEGPYLNALNKRGAGLHHIALDVLNTKKFVNQLVGTGWYLHPSSLNSYDSFKQVFLTRPNVATLIEINQVEQFENNNSYIQKLSFPFLSEKLLNGLCCKQLIFDQKIKLFLENKTLTIQEILKIK